MISIDGLVVTSGTTVLLDRTDARIRRGESIAVRGENGSGKTTLLRVLAGAQEPTRGVALIDGAPIDERAPRFRRLLAAMVGMPPFARDLTVAEHVTLIATTWGHDITAARQKSAAVLEELGLSRLEARFPHELSSGQTQLVALALVLARPFDVLLLDEPEQRLDAARIALVIAVLNRLRSEGTTIVMATHDDRIAGEAADRSLVLEPIQ